MTLDPIPNETLFLQPSGPNSGRYLPLNLPELGDEGFEDLVSRTTVWRPTVDPTPSRRYPGHSRGTMINSKTPKGGFSMLRLVNTIRLNGANSTTRDIGLDGGAR
ncbi:hypothetical protein GOD83_28245 [Sinorhizobium medicae]|nr:hypothetical protein [Sinorhizobium medicae]MDX0580497.1 hypothetical protein [Sinorhizobium medicae]MDX0784129.1 hypothetical protein [Sinorhizobium medicae]